MRTIKLPVQVKKSLIAINNQMAELHDKIDLLHDKKNESSKIYHEQFKNMFLGKHFLIKDSARDLSIAKYILIKEVSEPYLIHNDSYATCNLVGSVFDIRKSTHDGVTSTKIIFSDREHFYAHTEMKVITKSSYQEVVKQYKLLIK